MSAPILARPGTVTVVEVFWYGCPHCYDLQPALEKWVRQHAGEIRFIPVHVLWHKNHQAHARLYYTLRFLNRLDAHDAVFRAIHDGGQRLAADRLTDTLELQKKFAAKNGIAPERFATAFYSHEVVEAMKDAADLTKRYQVVGVPTVIVNDRYVSNVALTGSNEQLIKLLEDLFTCESKRMTKRSVTSSTTEICRSFL